MAVIMSVMVLVTLLYLHDWDRPANSGVVSQVVDPTPNKEIEVSEPSSDLSKDPEAPTSEEIAISNKIKRLYHEMNQNSEEYIPEAQIYTILSPQLGKTERELEDINWKVASFNWSKGVYQ